jgi:hypothetical protein
MASSTAGPGSSATTKVAKAVVDAPGDGLVLVNRLSESRSPYVCYTPRFPPNIFILWFGFWRFLLRRFADDIILPRFAGI